MKKLILLLLGLIPFGLSFLMESWMMSNQYSVLPLKLIGLLFLAFWGILGYLTSGFEKTILKSSAIIHLPGFVVILMLLYQEVILGRYLPNWIGSVSQLIQEEK